MDAKRREKTIVSVQVRERVKEQLLQRAQVGHRTLSGELRLAIDEHLHSPNFDHEEVAAPKPA